MSPPCAFLDRALDHVLGDVLGAGREDRGAQARIERRVGLAELGGGGDFARELAEQLGFNLILPPLAVHDVLELGMSSHRLLLNATGKPAEINETVEPVRMH